MFKNYVLIAFRTIKGNKISSLIAILGLSLGMTSALLLYSYNDYHLNYETFMPEGSHIRRLVSRRSDESRGEIYSGSRSVTRSTVQLLRDNVSFIEDMTSLVEQEQMTFSSENENFMANANFVEDNFFTMIPFPLIKGNRYSLLKEPDSIVLDKILAEKYYPQGDAMGKIITLPIMNDELYRVTGVVHIPANSHQYRDVGQAFIPNKILGDYTGDENGEKISWSGAVYFSPVRNFDEVLLQKELEWVLEMIPHTDKYKTKEFLYEDFNNIHLFSRENINDARNPLYMLILLMILTLALLTISIINSVSILTAQSIRRAREVGVRLVLGSSRKDLIFQFLTESVVLSFMALVMALVFTEILQPAFSNLVEIELDFSISPLFMIYLLLLTLTVGIVSGLYPAFYLSSLNVTESLKGQNLLKLGKFRKMLLVAQFLFASIFLLWTLTINSEFSLLQKMDPGFNSHNLLAIFPGLNFDSEPRGKLLHLKNELKEIDGLEEVTYSHFIPFFGGMFEQNRYISTEEQTEHLELYSLIDSDYLKVLGITPIEGEIEENSAVIMKSMNKYRDLHVGDLLELDSGNYRVSAIIDDYFTETPLYGYGASFHIVAESGFWFQLIRFTDGIDIKEIQKVWKQIFPQKVIEYEFINTQEYNNPEIVQIIKKVINISVIITLSISALGLFGLTLHTIKQKTKEIGIRKVMGAGFFSIIIQFLKETLSYILLAVLLGIPLGIYTIKQGLSILGYPHPIHNLYFISLFSAVSIILVGTLLIGTMVIKAARSNPSDALRYE